MLRTGRRFCRERTVQRETKMQRVSTKTRTILKISSGALFMAGLLALGLPFSKTATAHDEGEWSNFTVEVYEDGSSYKQVNVDPSEAQTVFAKGDLSYIEGLL